MSCVAHGHLHGHKHVVFGLRQNLTQALFHEACDREEIGTSATHRRVTASEASRFGKAENTSTTRILLLPSPAMIVSTGRETKTQYQMKSKTHILRLTPTRPQKVAR